MGPSPWTGGTALSAVTAVKPPFFIVGCPRSGTTLLQMLLDAHPRIAVPPESHVFDHFADIFRYYGNLERDGNLTLLVSDLLKDVRIRRWKLTAGVQDFCAGLQEKTLRGVISRLFELYAQKEGKSRWGDKTPEHMLHLAGIREVFPEAKFIHLIRDGRDAAESLKRMFFGPSTIDRIAALWKKYILLFESFKPSLPQNDYLEIYYEALVQEPEKILASLLEFLGEGSREDAARLVSEYERKVPQGFDPSIHPLAGKPVSSGKIGIFRRNLSRREIEIFEGIAGGELKTFGYSLVTDGKSRPAAWEKFFWSIEEQCLRFLRKLNQPEYIRDRIQDRSRRCLRSRRVPSP